MFPPVGPALTSTMTSARDQVRTTASKEIDLQVNLDSLSLESLKEKTLKELFGSDVLMLPATKVNRVVQQLGLDGVKALLPYLVEMAKPFARPPISKFRVGEAALGKSGNVYLGINIEFKGCPLNYAIHGEQFAFANARFHREKELVAIALPAAPCGHCRQFMHEAGTDMTIIAPSTLSLNSPYVETPLSTLLPRPFGPEDLKIEGRLMTRPPEFHSAYHDPLVAKAVEAAHDSYAPYSRSPAGVAIMTKQGNIYTGSNLDNAAYNPSLAPLQGALVALIANSGNYEDITDVVLVERSDREISHKGSSLDLLSTIAPQATFKHMTVDRFQ